MKAVICAACCAASVFTAQAQACIQVTPLGGDYDGVHPVQENGLAIVRRKGREGLMRSDGTLLVAPQYEGITEFFDGRAYFIGDGKRGLLDENGKVVFVDTQSESSRVFREGFMPVKRNGLWGYVNGDGQMVIPAQYDVAHIFSEGVAAVARDGKWQWIDGKGGVVADIAAAGIKNVRPLRGGVAVATREENTAAKRLADAAGTALKGEGDMLLVDRAGQVLVDGHFLLEPSESDPDAPIAFKTEAEGLWGLYDHQGKVVLEAKYENIGAFGDGLAPVKSANGKWGFIDEQGREAIAPVYDSVWHFSEGLAAVRKGGLTGYIDTQGREVIAPQALYTEYFHGEFARVKNMWWKWWPVNQEGLMDKSGRIVLAPEYSFVHLPFVDGRSFAARADKWEWVMLDASACKEENGKK